MLLSAEVWIAALIRRVETAGSFATIARRGERQFGAVLVKVFNLKTRDTYVLREAQRGDESVWIRPVDATGEAALDDWIARQARFDPDLWVVEIEDAEGRHFLTEKVMD